jgi:hypothetical protein
MTESVETIDAAASPPAERPSTGIITAILAILATALIAAGDAGLLHHALRHAFMWVAILAAVITCWPRGRGLRGAFWTAAGAVAAVALTTSPLSQVNVMAAPVLGAGLALSRTGRDRRMLGLAVQATAIFGIYRVAVTSIPVLWMAMDAAGSTLGHLGGAIARRPLSVGATFAGIDVLVLFGAFYVLWLIATPRSRLIRGASVAVAMVLGHLLYLALVARAADLAAALPVPPPDPNKMFMMPSDVPPWSFWPAVATLIPWNLVAVAGIIQLIVIGVALRLCRSPEEAARNRSILRFVAGALLLALVVAIPLSTCLYFQPASLEGKKIVVNKEGFINWLRPKHGDYGRLSIGMYGMLPDLVASYGGTLVQTETFSDEDLKDADAIILIFPNKPWKAGQLKRIWNFVEGGGSLLVMGEHTIHEDDPELDKTPADVLPKGYRAVPFRQIPGKLDFLGKLTEHANFIVITPEGEVLDHSLGATEEEAIRNAHVRHGSRFNDALFPTAMRVNFDCAEWTIGGWLDCYETQAHPTTAWGRGDRNDFGAVIGGSVRVRSPARPLILGKWGYEDAGDPGSPRAMIGNNKYDAGERLGDVCLAAEESFGRGKVIVFGDTSTLTNGINIGSYGYTGGLLSYVAGKTTAPSPMSQLFGLFAALAAIVLLAVRPPMWLVGTATVVLALTLGSCFAATHAANTPVPGKDPMVLDQCFGPGRASPTPIAYIDMSHLEAFSQEGLRDDGVMGLELTLMRNGYMALAMSDFDGQALQRASVFVSAAPLRPFSADEREAVRKFVEKGGLFIATVGWDERQGSEKLLADFGLRVGQAGPSRQWREPGPFGHFKAPFINIRGEDHYVRFWAAWPVSELWPGPEDAGGKGLKAEATVLAYGPGNVPVILMRSVGQNGGKVILVGDTCFIENKNLEHMDGSPFEGMRENADFWRWMLSFAGAGPEWLPPSYAPPPVHEHPVLPTGVPAVSSTSTVTPTDAGAVGATPSATQSSATVTQTAAPTESGVTP